MAKGSVQLDIELYTEIAAFSHTTGIKLRHIANEGVKLWMKTIGNTTLKAMDQTEKSSNNKD